MSWTLNYATNNSGGSFESEQLFQIDWNELCLIPCRLWIHEGEQPIKGRRREFRKRYSVSFVIVHVRIARHRIHKRAMQKYIPGVRACLDDLDRSGCFGRHTGRIANRAHVGIEAVKNAVARRGKELIYQLGGDTECFSSVTPFAWSNH